MARDVCIDTRSVLYAFFEVRNVSSGDGRGYGAIHPSPSPVVRHVIELIDTDLQGGRSFRAADRALQGREGLLDGDALRVAQQIGIAGQALDGSEHEPFGFDARFDQTTAFQVFFTVVE